MAGITALTLYYLGWDHDEAYENWSTDLGYYTSPEARAEAMKRLDARKAEGLYPISYQGHYILSEFQADKEMI